MSPVFSRPYGTHLFLPLDSQHFSAGLLSYCPYGTRLAACFPFLPFRLHALLREAVLLFNEPCVVDGQVVPDLREAYDREVVAEGEGELDAVHLPVVLEVGAVAPDEEARFGVEVERRGRASRGRRLDDVEFGVALLLRAPKLHLRVEAFEVDRPPEVGGQLHLGQFRALDPPEAHEGYLLVAVLAREAAAHDAGAGNIDEHHGLVRLFLDDLDAAAQLQPGVRALERALRDARREPLEGRAPADGRDELFEHGADARVNPLRVPLHFPARLRPRAVRRLHFSAARRDRDHTRRSGGGGAGGPRLYRAERGFELRVAPGEQRAAVELDGHVGGDAVPFDVSAVGRHEVREGVLQDRARRQLLRRRGERRAGAALADDHGAPRLAQAPRENLARRLRRRVNEHGHLSAVRVLLRVDL